MKKLLFLVFIISGCATEPQNDSVPAPQVPSKNGGNEVEGNKDSSHSGEVAEEANEPAPQPGNANYDQLKSALDSGNAKKIEDMVVQYLAHNPKDSRALNVLGVQQLKANKPSTARMIFKKAMDADPRNASIVNNYALTYMAENEEWRAIQEFKRALEIDPRNAAAAANLGSIHAKAKNYNEARRWLEIAYDKNKSNVKVANNFALALRGTGDYSAAKRVYEKSGAAESKDMIVLLNYAYLLVENLNDKTKGQTVINKIKFLTSDPAIMERAKMLEAKIK